VSSNVIDNKC
jgi:hypothetical protein